MIARIFRNISIGRKLMLIIMITSGVAILFVGGIFVVNDLLVLNRTMKQDLWIMGQILGANSAASLVFGDTKVANENLNVLRAQPHIMAAALYTKEGQILASYLRDKTIAIAFPRLPLTSGEIFNFRKDRLEIFQDIFLDDQKVGAIYIQKDTLEMVSRLKQYSLITLTILLSITAVIYVLAHKLQHVISDPIANLAETARVISAEKNYAIRASKYGDDELGRFVDVFNEMLEQIQIRNEELQKQILERTKAEQQVLSMNVTLEERVAERTAQLEVSNKELEAFSYSVAHDLRAPLRSIDGFAKILLDDYAPQLEKKAQHYLDLVRNNAQQMGQLIKDLLDLARIGRQPIVKKIINPAIIVHQCLQDLQEEQKRSNLKIEIGELPPCEADANLLRQVYVNLLSNALKFTQKKAEAHIEVGCLENSGLNIYFVRDNGTGFDMQYADKLFGVFQRLHRAEDYQGTGVGLAIVEHIVKRHGGKVWAESEVGKGATFYFTLT
ncbi:MAG: hypothetical protein ACD_73C00054G0003 [uncultured bacterium]|nr:MAG: hypothetical protein ACD_73C00054G0003 [uncultured bacterium]